MANDNPRGLIDKINALPKDRVAEIEDFVDFIGQREHQRSLTRSAAATSGPAFFTVWANPEDDAYDAI